MAKRLKNQLNDLTGSEWLFWTDTIYITNYAPDATHVLRKEHGAMKPPELMADIIKFFTKEGEKVLDPFAGVGGTLLGAVLTSRKALGIELNPEWVNIYSLIANKFILENGLLVEKPLDYQTTYFPPMWEGDCIELLPLLEGESIDAVITDPPYGCNHNTSVFGKETNFNMFNPCDPRDLANAKDLETFLKMLEVIGKEVWRVLKPKKYFVLIIGDRYQQGEFIPLGFMVSQRMRRLGFKLKGIKIWTNKATQRHLKPYAVMSCFVPNITHQNILILRKG